MSISEDKSALQLTISWKLVCLFLLLAAVLAALAPFLRDAAEIKVYMKAADRVVAGEQFYRTDDPPAYSYPPFSVLPFTLFVPFETQQRVVLWWFVNLLLLGYCVYVVTAMCWPTVKCGLSNGGPPLLVNMTVITVLSGQYLLAVIGYQSNDLIVFALVVTAAWWLSCQKTALAGLFGGLAAACKATPLLFVVLLGMQRRFIACVALLLAIGAASVLPDVMFGSPDGQWLAVTWYQKFVAKLDVGSAPQVEGTWQAWNPINQSVSGTVHRYFSDHNAPNSKYARAALIAPLTPPQVSLLTRVSQVAVLLLVCWSVFRRVPAERDQTDRSFFALGQVSAIICGMLLLSPMSSTQHYCMLLAPISFITTHWIYRERSFGIALSLLFILTASLAGGKDLVGMTIKNAAQDYGLTMWGTIVCLVATGYILTRGYQSAAAVEKSSTCSNTEQISRVVKSEHESNTELQPAGSVSNKAA